MDKPEIVRRLLDIRKNCKDVVTYDAITELVVLIESGMTYEEYERANELCRYLCD